MIAFLHTLSSNVEKFEALAKKYNADCEVKHFVNEKILVDALATGVVDYEAFNAEVEEIKREHPDKIICTCSTFGEASDRRGDVWRIDRPMAALVVSRYTKIGLAYAATSTRGASADLLLAVAREQGREVELVDIDCSRAWPSFEAKDMDGYASKIADEIRQHKDGVEVVFLAQASMEGAKAYLEDFPVEVLASPEYGVACLLGDDL